MFFAALVGRSEVRKVSLESGATVFMGLAGREVSSVGDLLKIKKPVEHPFYGLLH